MILPKQEISKRKVVSELLSQAQFQPCGVDLSLKKVCSFSSPGQVDHDNSERKISEVSEIPFDESGWVYLPKGAYKIVYNETVKIPKDCAALGFPRSTLLRCGADVHCAVWDPGYEGRSESLLIVENSEGIRLKKGARVVQLVFFKLSEKTEAYNGRFQNENPEKAV